MAKKKVLGSFTMPLEGDIIDQIAGSLEAADSRDTPKPSKDLPDRSEDLPDRSRSLSEGYRNHSDRSRNLSEGSRSLPDRSRNLSEGSRDLSERSEDHKKPAAPVKSSPPLPPLGMKEADLIKEGADFKELLHRFGITGNFNGSPSAMIRCPFHEDKNPSCSINFEKKLFNCFGCGKKGDIIDFVKEFKGTDFKGALEFLAGKSTGSGPGVEKKGESKPIVDREVSGPEPVDQETLDSSNLLEEVIKHYHKKLLANEKALDYLDKRGLKDFTLIKEFKLGYCDGKTLLPKCSGKQKEALKETGILNKQGKELFTGCITFPCFTKEGKPGEVYGRRLSGREPKHLYLPGPHRGVFNRQASKIYDTIILTESIIDALSLFRMGIKNVQPLFGTGGLTDEHRQHLKEAPHSSFTIVLGMDNDEAGKKAAEKYAGALKEEGFKVKTIFPQNKDWNEDLVKGRKAEALLEEIEKAEVLEKEKAENKAFKITREKSKYLVASDKIRYRLQGVKLSFVNNLKVNIKAECEEKKFMDNVDLYSHRSRTTFSHHLAPLFDLPFQKIENDLIAMVEYLEAERDKALEESEAAPHRLTEQEKALGMELLTSPYLFNRIVEDLSLLGYVGEDLNKQLVYISATTRKMKDPISIMIVSQSASGKSLLVETVRKLMPPEDVVAVSSLSDQALNYIPEGGLLHKFLLLGEAVHSEVVEHQIREMLSNHELSRMVTTKNNKTGVMESQTVRTEVIVSAMMSSTRYDINPENASRCFVLNTDESRLQTRNIHQAQQRKYTLSRIREKQSRVPEIIRQHQAAQRLLKERLIINPLAEHLDFPDTLMRTRRDHERFIDLIAGICFLRQYQKEEKTIMEDGKEIRFLECDMTDYRIAYEIITGILPATISNFPRSAIQLYNSFRDLVCEIGKKEKLLPEDVLISQKEIREQTQHNQWFVKRYMKILVDYEYIVPSGRLLRGSRRTYKLAANEAIHLLDLSMIPSPEAMEKKLKES